MRPDMAVLGLTHLAPRLAEKERGAREGRSGVQLGCPYSAVAGRALDAAGGFRYDPKGAAKTARASAPRPQAHLWRRLRAISTTIAIATSP